MENTVHPEPELQKQEESISEGTPLQTNELAQDEKKSSEIDLTKKLQDELAEAKDKYVRLYAEFDNFRRRNAKERVELITSANEQLLKALLPVVDDFDRAEKSFKEKNDKEAEGFFLIQNKFKKTLDQFNVKAMDINQTSDFNPDLHEAITQMSVPDEKLKGKIIDVVEKGYLLGEKVIRFAKVVVGN